MSNTPSFPELFFSRTKDYLDLFLSRQEKRSPDTVKAYRISLTAFYEYVTKKKEIRVMNFCFSDCTYEFVLSYSLYLQDELQLSRSTVNQRLAAIKSYLKYVADTDIELMQIYLGIQKVPLLRISKRQRPVLEKDIIKDLLSKPDATEKGNRDMVLLILLFDSAVRVSELSAITLGDVSLQTSIPSIVIHGKGKKERCISLSPETVRHLRAYVEHYHKHDAPPDTPLFYTVIHGEINHMSVRNIERIIKKYADLIRGKYPDLPDSIYPHMFRRTRASGLYRDGVPLEMISAILGHSNSETTKIYAIPSVEQLRDAISKGQPPTETEPKMWKDKEAEMRKMFGLN